MERYLVPTAPPAKPNPSPPRTRWSRITPELDGRISTRFRREASRLLLDSYSEVGAFEHSYYIGSEMCPTHMARMANAMNQDMPIPPMRDGITGMEFDKQGIYLASVTKSGCLTVHDFESLYCTVYGPSACLSKDDSKHLLHLYTSQSLDAVQWNPANQDEVACSSRQSDKILLYDIGYISAEPVEVLEKGKQKLSGSCYDIRSGLSDITFDSTDKSRLLASGMDGSIYLWDRRLSHFSSLQLRTNAQSQLNSIQLDMDGQVVFGASEHGIIYAWDLRGGRTSIAFQSHNEVYYPLLASMKIAAMLEKITSLKEQSNISAKDIHSISIDPCCPCQLAFHLEDGWSGVLNISSFNITHVHCPPPAWSVCMDTFTCSSNRRKPSWLHTCSIYAIGSSSDKGIYLLDFYPDVSSACHVDFDEESGSNSGDVRQVTHKRLIPASQSILVCAAHPLNGTIVAGTKESSLLVISQNASRGNA